MQKKTCTKCKRKLNLDKFYEGGRKSSCKECQIWIVRRWQSKNLDKVRGYKRAYGARVIRANQAKECAESQEPLGA